MGGTADVRGEEMRERAVERTGAEEEDDDEEDDDEEEEDEESEGTTKTSEGLVEVITESEVGIESNSVLIQPAPFNCAAERVIGKRSVGFRDERRGGALVAV